MKAFVCIITSILVSYTALAESNLEAWAGKGIALSSQNQILAEYQILMISKDLGFGQSISYVFYDINPTKANSIQALSEKELEQKATCVVTRKSKTNYFVNCEDGAGIAKCLGRICKGVYATDDGDAFTAVTVHDPKVKRRSLTKVKGEGPVKNLREILFPLPKPAPSAESPNT